MCGIAGVFGQPAYRDVEKMLVKLKHRGPAGQDIQDLPEGTLGYVRLSIIDGRGGQQPMNVEGAHIICDGELYNYRELARDHLADEILETPRDIEVLVRLYRKYGPTCLELLHGMFAFAIMQEGELFLARDPLGIKPLYFGRQADGFYFASEIKALAVISDEIYEFPAGHWFHSVKGWRSYYELASTSLKIKTAAEAVVAIRNIVNDAVHLQLPRDMPVGISLSGGLDSSIIALLASRATEHLHSFAVGMENSEDLRFARNMAEVLRTQHHERIYSEQEMLEALPKVIYHLESCDPGLIRSAIPSFFLAEMASQYVKIILTGDGADEIYAGQQSTHGHSPELQEEMIDSMAALHNTKLQLTDRIPMAFGLQTRCPFLDMRSVALGLGLPIKWKFHRDKPAKFLLRQAFAQDLPEEVINRPKQNFCFDARSSGIFVDQAEYEISDVEFHAEFNRLLAQWDYELVNKEALYFYWILRQNYEDHWIFPTMGRSRSS